MNRPAVRAGIIGGLAAAVLSLLSILPVPLLSCLSLPLQWLAFLGTGALAASWMLPPRRGVATEGLVAGLIAALIGGLAGMLLAPVGLALSGGAVAITNQLPPESLRAFEEAGINPEFFFGTGGALVAGGLCCGFNIVAGIALGALGGVLYGAMKSS